MECGARVWECGVGWDGYWGRGWGMWDEACVCGVGLGLARWDVCVGVWCGVLEFWVSVWECGTVYVLVRVRVFWFGV